MQIDIFQGYNVRTEVKNGEVLFNLSDVHRALGVGKPSDTVNRLKESYVDTIDTPTQFGVKPMHYVTERGLIRVLQTSRSPKAGEFQDWADERVEQLMRGHTVNAGGVVAAAKSEDALILRAFTTLQTRVAEQAKELEVARPKVAAYEEFMGAKGSVSVGDAAKLLTRSGIVTGEKRLFDFLDCDAHWTSKNKLTRKRRIMQTAVERGLLEYKAQSYEHPRTGERVVTDPQIRVTPKGLHKLRELLLPPMDIELLEVV